MSDDTARPRRSDRHKKSVPTQHKAAHRASADESRSGKASGSKQKPKSGSAEATAQRRRRRGRIALIVGAVVLVLLGVGTAFGYNFVQGINNKIHPIEITDPALQAALQKDAPPPGAPFYMLLVGSDGRPAGSNIQGARSDTLMVARIDPQKKSIMLVSIMRDSRVSIPGHEINKINAAYSYGGVQLALETVRQLTGLPITKYMDVGFQGFESIVNSMGGVWFNVPEAINGVPNGEVPTPWDKKNRLLKKGYQKLNGAQALVFVRERHQFANQDYTRVKDQQAFLKALAKQVLQVGNIFQAPQIINAVAGDVRTNMSLADLANLVMQMKGMKATDIQSTTLPSSVTSINGVSYVVINQGGMDATFARMEAGGPLVPGAKKAPNAKASSAAPSATSATSLSSPAASTISLTIRNGAGVAGLAKQAATFFTSHGFKISDTGNASQYVYGQTLVVYKPSSQAKAQAVVDALGYGKIVPAGTSYTFNGDVLVVIGKDWKSS
jgi:LCP family protein required for cell wall assembly